MNIGCSFGDGVCGVLGALPWKRRLLNSGSGRRSRGRAAGGRAGGRAAVGRAGRVFNRPLVNAFLQRGLLNMGCSLGDGVCGVLGALNGGWEAVGALLEIEALEYWVDRTGGRAGGICEAVATFEGCWWGPAQRRPTQIQFRPRHPGGLRCVKQSPFSRPAGCAQGL